MGHRNMLCTNQTADCFMDEEEWRHPYPQPCPHPIVGSMTAGNIPSPDVHHLTEPYNCITSYGMMPHASVEHHHPSRTSQFYNPYISPSANTTIFGVSFSHGSSEQLPTYGNLEFSGIPFDDYERKQYLDVNVAPHKMMPSANTMLFGISLSDETSKRVLDDNRGSYNRNNAEAIQGNSWHSEASTSTSSSETTSRTMHFEPVVGLVNSESLAPAHFRNDEISFDVAGAMSDRTPRNRSGFPNLNLVVPQSDNFLVPGDFVGQDFGSIQSTWLHQQHHNDSDNGSSVSWNQAPTAPRLHGSSVSGRSFTETGNSNVLGYHNAAGNFPLHCEQRLQNVHFLPPPPPPHMQGLMSHNVDFLLRGAMSSFRLPRIDTSHGNIYHSNDGVTTGIRRRDPSTGLRIYCNQDRGAVREPTPRPNNLPFVGIFPSDEFPVLEFPESDNSEYSVDHHEDMRLDIEDMSYEELLALGEQIGSVNTGLSEDAIKIHLKTRTHLSSATYINLEEPACEDQETNSCSICQCGFENQEKIGTLDCGHEYHADCLKKWLLVKNICPICKSSSLPVDKK